MSKLTQLAMSKPVGKVLDSKVGKVGVAVGNAVIGGTRRFGRLLKKGFTFPDEGKLNKEQDRKNRANAPVGAVGGTNRGEYKGKDE